MRRGGWDGPVPAGRSEHAACTREAPAPVAEEVGRCWMIHPAPWGAEQRCSIDWSCGTRCAGIHVQTKERLTAGSFQGKGRRSLYTGGFWQRRACPTATPAAHRGSPSPAGRSFPGPVGGLVLAWSQRIEVEDSPTQFKSKIQFTASTFLKTSAMIELQRYTAEEAGLSPLLPPSSQERALRREKSNACCFYRLYVCLLIAPWHLMFTAGFL